MGVIDDNRLQTPGRSGYFRRTSVSYTQHDKRLIMQRHIEHRRRGTQGTSHTNLRTEYCITAMLRSANILTRVRKKTDTRRQPAPPPPPLISRLPFPSRRSWVIVDVTLPRKCERRTTRPYIITLRAGHKNATHSYQPLPSSSPVTYSVPSILPCTSQQCKPVESSAASIAGKTISQHRLLGFRSIGYG